LLSVWSTERFDPALSRELRSAEGGTIPGSTEIQRVLLMLGSVAILDAVDDSHGSGVRRSRQLYLSFSI
jgi:hypothetical protein